MAGYELIDKRVRLKLISGLDSRILVNQASIIFSQSNTYNDIANRNYNAFTLWGGLSAELSYRLSDHYELSIVPGYRMSFMEMERNSGVKMGLKEIGFNMRYIFEK